MWRFLLIFRSLSYSMPLSFSYSHIVLVNYFTKSDDPTQTSLPTQQIDNIGFILGWNFWLTSHRRWESLAYIKESTGRSKISIFHKVFTYPFVSISFFYAKHIEANEIFWLISFKFDVLSRLQYFLVFLQSKYFSVSLVLYNVLVNFPYENKVVWKNKISEIYTVKQYFLSIIIDCRKLLIFVQIFQLFLV